jgi:hypothetical protein
LIGENHFGSTPFRYETNDVKVYFLLLCLHYRRKRARHGKEREGNKHLGKVERAIIMICRNEASSCH